jgi:tetratricopeptide (TPR) repeat protein
MTGVAIFDPAQEREENIAKIRASYSALQEAEDCRLAGDLPRAQSLCYALVRQYPDYWAANHTMGLIYSDLGQSQDALVCFIRATLINPKNVMSLTALAGCYLTLENMNMARVTIGAAMALAPEDVNVVFLQAEILFVEHKYEMALASYEQVIRSDPGFAAAYGKSGSCHIALGNNAAAVKSFEQALAADPSIFPPLDDLSKLPPALITIDLIAKLAVSNGPALSNPAEAKAAIAFTRGSTLHAHGRYAEAWQSVVAANRAIYPLKGQSPAIVAASLKKRLAYVRSAEQLGFVTGDDPSKPQTLLFLGCSRAGKSSLETLIGRTPSVHKTYEDTLFEQSFNCTMSDGGLAQLGFIDVLPKELHYDFIRNYFADLRARSYSADIFTNTNPSLLPYLPWLLKIVPNIRTLCIKRNIDDLALKIYMSNYHFRHEYAYDLNSIRDSITWTNNLIDVLAAAYPKVVKVVDYETLVEAPASVLRIVADLCAAPELALIDKPSVYDDRNCAAPYLQWMQDEARESAFDRQF